MAGGAAGRPGRVTVAPEAVGVHARGWSWPRTLTVAPSGGVTSSSTTSLVGVPWMIANRESSLVVKRTSWPSPVLPSWRVHGLVPKIRSEEHTSELQSLMSNAYAVFCMKKQHNQNNTIL